MVTNWTTRCIQISYNVGRVVRCRDVWCRGVRERSGELSFSVGGGGRVGGVGGTGELWSGGWDGQ